VAEFATLLKAYGVLAVRGDRYGGVWPRERFCVHGVDYQPSSKTTSDIYLELLPILNSNRAELLDHARLVMQLCQLERHAAGSGKDSIRHAPGSHDDVINAAAGAIVTALNAASQEVTSVSSEADIDAGILAAVGHEKRAAGSERSSKDPGGPQEGDKVARRAGRKDDRRPAARLSPLFGRAPRTHTAPGPVTRRVDRRSGMTAARSRR
jgi:hypothetical protein